MSGQIDGIISGFNTEEMIEAIIKYEALSVELVQAQQTEATNKLTTWNSIEALLVSIKADASLLSDKSLWKAKSATSSHEDIISVSSSTNATPGRYFLTVDQLATNHQTASQGISSLTQTFGSGTFEIQVGNGSPTVITVDNSNNNLNALKDAINASNAGVTAAVINDGSETNPYRLVLTANESGAAGEITVTTNLTGSEVPMFSPQFDLPEKLSWSDNATSNPILSTGSTYTGDENKTYTFTVGGTGEQTVGNGDIEINWSDGTNSGTITVSATDTDIELTGAGADGLSVYFSAGTLVAGDTFQVQAFAPTVQQGQDAQVRLGSTMGGGSPIVFTHYSNTITDLIDGVTLELNSLSDGQQVEINISEDRDKIKGQITSFITKYNEYQDFIDEQFAYNEETGEAGMLLGETSLMLLQNDIRSTLTNNLTGLPDNMRRLAQAGVTFNSRGKLDFDSSVFDEAMDENFADLMNLFRSSGATNSTKIEYISSSASTKISTSGYDVNITQAATQGSFTGTAITNPGTTPLTLDSTNNRIKLTINNITTDDIILAERTYNSGADLAKEIEDKINSDRNVSGIGVTVEWVDSGSNGHLVIRTDTYGDTSTINMDTVPTNSGHDILGFTNGTAEAGLDVEGTINGESATGNGQYLIGDNGNDNTAGLKLLITFTEPELVAGEAEGSVFFNKGFADVLNDKLTGYTDPYDGSLKSRKNSLQSQIDAYAKRIETLEYQLNIRRVSLYKQFQEMESALADLQSQQDYLTSQISSLNSNWVKNSSS